MKAIFALLIAVLFLAGCPTPKKKVVPEPNLNDEFFCEDIENDKAKFAVLG